MVAATVLLWTNYTGLSERLNIIIISVVMGVNALVEFFE